MYSEFFIIDRSLSKKLDIPDPPESSPDEEKHRFNNKDWLRIEKGIFLRRNIYGLRYRFKGVQYRESARTTSLREARELLELRKQQIKESYLNHSRLLITQRANMSYNPPPIQ